MTVAHAEQLRERTRAVKEQRHELPTKLDLAVNPHPLPGATLGAAPAWATAEARDPAFGGLATAERACQPADATRDEPPRELAAHTDRPEWRSRPFVAPVLLCVAFAAWALGASLIRRSTLGSYGVLASADVWFIVGFVGLVGGFVVELAGRKPRGWLLASYLVALIVAIHATVPILYGTPEYDWVYKHIGITQSLGTFGRITDPSNIYQQWPALFAAGAAASALGHLGPLSYATWAPLAFELADALLILGAFRVLVADRRVAWVAVLLYEGLISWVGQDYYSPQAFAYLLWFGIVLIIVRWLRAPSPAPDRYGRLARLRAPMLVGIGPVAETPRAMRALALTLVAGIYFAIVAAHQLTPYVALAAVGALAMLDVVRPRWLPLLLATIAVAYLVPRYNLIAHNFGGLFSGFNPFANASGKSGTQNAGAEATTALIVRGLAGSMWLLALAAILRRRSALGRVVIPATLAFSPFVVLVAQSYGGEAVYRVFMFSAPWCALLIAQALFELRAPLGRWVLVGFVSTVALFASLQGLYSPVRVYSFTPKELSASRWLYGHIARGSLVVLPVDDFPSLDTANYNAYSLAVMPADPQVGKPTLNEHRLGDVEQWIAGFGHPTAYVVTSRSMTTYADYFGWPRGYERFVSTIRTAPGWSVVYKNTNTTIYRLDLASTTPAAAPIAAAPTPATIARARGRSGASKARQRARGSVRST